MNEREKILNKLLEILQNDTDVKLETVNEAVSLREGLGLDSVDLVGIIMRIEEFYRIRLNHQELEGCNTVGTLIDLIESKLVNGTTSLHVQKAA
ncbi:acyl carrier protein [Telmatocola sphagniphila]|uniref:Acyl carrier protein n=1 Tax=Telmatocola sphagniphila TaxID=1123043 RepID=A0A8E6BB51_9BACT|nr:acyl carrier protein [Telmatocola sphagniphila]QVL34682.1 acyl carrier protein [Telmatocola sphagniphila]